MISAKVSGPSNAGGQPPIGGIAPAGVTDAAIGRHAMMVPSTSRRVFILKPPSSRLLRVRATRRLNRASTNLHLQYLDYAQRELFHVLMLPDFERADRIGEFWGYPQSRAFAELLIDCEEDRVLRAVLVGMLREADRGR